MLLSESINKQSEHPLVAAAKQAAQEYSKLKNRNK